MIVVFAVVSALEDRRELRIVFLWRTADDDARAGEKADRFGEIIGGFPAGRGDQRRETAVISSAGKKYAAAARGVSALHLG